MNELKTNRIGEIARTIAGDPTSKIARSALELLDGERVSSLPSIVSSFEVKRQAINADPELSAVGKRERTRAAASAGLSNVAVLAKQVVALEAEHQSNRNAAIARAAPPVSDAPQTLVDLALAAMVRAENPVATKLVMASERVRQAVARLPRELSGITEEAHARIVGTFIDPADAAALAEEAKALPAVREAIQHGITELARDAQWEPRQLVQGFGRAWKLPGLTDALAELMEAESAAA